MDYGAITADLSSSKMKLFISEMLSGVCRSVKTETPMKTLLSLSLSLQTKEVNKARALVSIRQIYVYIIFISYNKEINFK